MDNFVSVFEELSKIYESDELEATVAEADVDELPAEEVEVAIEEPVAEAPKQLVVECSKCGALAIKAEEDVVVDEATDLANVEEVCKACEEAAGYKILGELVSFDTDEEEVVVESKDLVLTEGKVKDSIKKIATRLGADGATIMRAFAETISDLIKNDDLYDAAEYVENKAVLKALESGNETVLNTSTKEDIEELVQDIEKFKKDREQAKAEKHLKGGLFDKRVEKTLKASEVRKGDHFVDTKDWGRLEDDKDGNKPWVITDVDTEDNQTHIGLTSGDVHTSIDVDADQDVKVLTKRKV